MQKSGASPIYMIGIEICVHCEDEFGERSNDERPEWHQTLDVVSLTTSAFHAEKDLARIGVMSRVCRVWYLAAAPLLWRQVYIKWRHPEGMHEVNSLASLLSSSRSWHPFALTSLVQKLVFWGARTHIETHIGEHALFSKLPNMTELVLRVRPVDFEGLLSWLCSLPSSERLTALVLHGTPDSDLTDDVGAAIARACPNLRALRLRGSGMDEGSALALITKLSHLEEISLPSSVSERACTTSFYLSTKR